jgi:hypothetical protein
VRLRVAAWLLHPRFLWEFLWRLLEREVEDRGDGDTTGPPGYAYGKVTGLSPDILVMTEVSEYPYVCCGWCAGGMACRTVRPSLGSTMNSTAHPMRSKGGRPHNAGNNASELRVGASKAHGVTLKAIAVSEIRGRLRGGYAVTAALTYDKLPAYLRVQGGSFGHAVMLYGIKGSGANEYVGFFDALWPQGARGAWCKFADIDQALWSDGEHSTTTVKQPKPPIPPTPTPIPPEPVPEPPQPTPEPEPPPSAAEVWDAAVADRDEAWREYTGLEQPNRRDAGWGPTSLRAVRWQRFYRWGPVPNSGWSSGMKWSDGEVWMGDLGSEYGRLLAERDRLVASGIDPRDLMVPDAP